VVGGISFERMSSQEEKRKRLDFYHQFFVQDHIKRQTRFTSKRPAKDIIACIDTSAKSMGFSVQIRNYKMRLEGLGGNAGQLAVAIEVITAQACHCPSDHTSCELYATWSSSQTHEWVEM
jgi:hypothetical protein